MIESNDFCKAFEPLREKARHEHFDVKVVKHDDLPQGCCYALNIQKKKKKQSNNFTTDSMTLAWFINQNDSDGRCLRSNIGLAQTSSNMLVIILVLGRGPRSIAGKK
jgi:hypothetical protein